MRRRGSGRQTHGNGPNRAHAWEGSFALAQALTYRHMGGTGARNQPVHTLRGLYRGNRLKGLSNSRTLRRADVTTLAVYLCSLCRTDGTAEKHGSGV